MLRGIVLIALLTACGGRSDLDGYASNATEAGPSVDATSDADAGNVQLAGIDIAPSSLDFGDVRCGSTAAPQTINVTNKSDAPFSFTAKLASVASFTIAPTSAVLAPSETVPIVVTPLPMSVDSDTAANAYGTTLDITTTLASDVVHHIALAQTAKGAVLSWSSTLAFGRRLVGTVATMPLDVTNDGNADATITIQTSAPFSAPSTLTVPAHTTKSFDVDYTPDATELGLSTTTTLSIDSPDVVCATSLPAGITLSGTAYDLATAIGAADMTTCALGQSGNLYCWGQGPVGDGSSTNHATPALTKATGVTSIAGDGNTLCVVESGVVQCWGDGQVGQLGNGTKNSSALPVTVSGLSNISLVTRGSGAFSFCAIHQTGLVSCWGGNSNGQCGDGTSSASITTPTAGFTNVSNAVAGSMSQDVGCVLRSDGSIACAGMNIAGELGNGGTPSSSDTPVTVSGITTATGLSGRCAVLADETVRCWGDGYDGELGNGKSGLNTIALTPVDVSNLTDAIAVAAGLYFNCALEAGGAVVCWGENSYGSLGNGTTTSSSVPVAVTGITTATTIAAAYEHACAILSGGSVVCWGKTGQQSSSIPVEVDGF